MARQLRSYPNKGTFFIHSFFACRLSHKIRVFDTGIGIEPEDQARLFQMFGRGSSEDVRRREGTGLGLRLSQQQLALLGGWIEVQSEVGVGGTFTLTLPASGAGEP